MTAQDRTLDRYQELMQINAAGHVLRAARELGIFDALRKGQRTAEQLAEELQLDRRGLDLLLDCLLSINVIERYEDDHALAPVMQLLCRYDADLGDESWQRLADSLRGRTEPAVDDRRYFDSLAATQWIHTPAAMQAAEMLDIGGEAAVQREAAGGSDAGASGSTINILDLGCGSAVWSCAMAYRAAGSRVVAVDYEPALQAARSTADSIQLTDRFQTISGNPETVELAADEFDLAIIAQRLHAADRDGRVRLLSQARRALRPGGKVVVIDLFRGPAKPRLSETLEALRMHLETDAGRMHLIEELESELREQSFHDVRFSFIAASRVNLGMMVASLG